jgi:hypothetical protein
MMTAALKARRCCHQPPTKATPSMQERTKIIVTNTKTKDWHHMKVTILTLPGDITCKVDNVGNSKGKLMAKFWIQKIKVKGSLEQVDTFVFWQVTIEREACCLE